MKSKRGWPNKRKVAFVTPPVGPHITLPLPTAPQLMVQSQDIDPEAWEVVGAILSRAYAVGTTRHVDCGYRSYLHWCHENNRIAVPATTGTVVLYYNSRLHLSLTGMTSSAKAVMLLHRYYGLPSPNDCAPVRALLAAHRKSAKPHVPKKALTDDDLREMVRLADTHRYPLMGKRDATIILVLFASAERGADLENAAPGHVKFFESGMTLRIPFSKGDQFGEGQTIFVGRSEDPRFCAVTRLEAWLEIHSGPSLFPQMNARHHIDEDTILHAAGMRKIIKRYVAKLGYDPDQYGCHSTRSGFVTQSYKHGVPEAHIQYTARHKNRRTTQGYNQFDYASAPSIMDQLGF